MLFIIIEYIHIHIREQEKIREEQKKWYSLEEKVICETEKS
jgi:hypothetical protein